MYISVLGQLPRISTYRYREWQPESWFVLDAEQFCGFSNDGDIESNEFVFDRVLKFLGALYQFSRPHTVAGTVTSICSISLLAIQRLEYSPAMIGALAMSLSSAVLMNVFIVGLNQIFDVNIDKINKPYLPLASGEFTKTTAWIVIWVSLMGSMMIGCLSGSWPLVVTLVVSMLLGVCYSVENPLLRWKRNAFAAATCILLIRAVAVQIGFYLHTRYCLGLTTFSLSKEVICAVGLFAYYSVVIALFKDIPDIKGDIKANVRTFTVRMGQKSVFWICIWLLTAMYSSAVVLGLCSNVFATKVVFSLGNALSLLLLWKEALRLNLNQKKEISRFYMFVWKLFYLLYFFVPFLKFTA